jgi:Fe-S-cluster containining protein
MSQEQTSERGCGDCNACCQHLWIDDPELQKPLGVLCTNWKSGCGCTIYDSRPPACRAFLCGWRQLEALPLEWRPDHSKILMITEKQDIPPQYIQSAVKFILLDVRAVTWPPLVERLAHLVEQRLPAFLQVTDPATGQAQKLFITDVLKPVVATRHYQTICNTLLQLVQMGINDMKRQAQARQPAGSAYAPFSRP